MKKLYILLLISLSTVILAQKESCSTPESEILEDLNSITKCTIDDNNNKKTNQLKVRVSAPKKRFLKKRVAAKKKASGILNTTGVSSTSKSLDIDKIISLSNRLSSEEVKKAEKFMTVDEVPAFKNCENSTGSDRLNCFNSEMISHIERHFNYPNEAFIKKIEGEVWVRFIIDTNGNISNIKALSPKNTELLKEEAIRVVSHLPKFNPAKKDGKAVSVKYGFPINFSLD